MNTLHVGLRVEVYWEDEEEWFAGVVSDIDPEQGWFVVYDDGDERWEEKQELIRVEETSETSPDYHEVRGELNTPAVEVSVSPNIETTIKPSNTIPGDGDLQVQSDLPLNSDMPTTICVSEQRRRLSSNSNHSSPEETHEHNSDPGKCSERNAVEENSDKLIPKDEISTGMERFDIPKQSVNDEVSKTWLEDGTYSARPRCPMEVLLSGLVLCIPNFRSEPEASAGKSVGNFVRISFVDDDNDTLGYQNPMLRCKTVLETTSIKEATTMVTWNDSEAICGSEQCDENETLDGAFQLLLKSSRQGSSKRFEVTGTLYFTLYSCSLPSNIGLENASTVSKKFVAEASLSLQRVVDAMIDEKAEAKLWELDLMSRGGHLIECGEGNTYSKLHIWLDLEAHYEEPTVNRLRSSYVQSMHDIAQTPAHWTVGVVPRLPLRGYYTQSIPSNRRGTNQLGHDSRETTPRTGRRDGSRGRVRNVNPAVPRGCKPPRYTHEASATINRRRFHQRIANENKTKGQTLCDIAQTVKKINKSTMHDDKEHERDRRERIHQEKDYIMQKAQAEYQRRGELADKIELLERDIGDVKEQVVLARNKAKRLDIVISKDQYVLDCFHASQHDNKEKMNTTNTEVNENVEHLREEVSILASRLKKAQRIQGFRHQLTSGSKLRNASAEARMQSRKASLSLSQDEEELWDLYQAQKQIGRLQANIRTLQNIHLKHQSKLNANESKHSGRLKIEAQLYRTELCQLQEELRQYEQLPSDLTSETENQLQAKLDGLHELVYLCRSYTN